MKSLNKRRLYKNSRVVELNLNNKYKFNKTKSRNQKSSSNLITLKKPSRKKLELKKNQMKDLSNQKIKIGNISMIK
jgi:hypothetical protein